MSLKMGTGGLALELAFLPLAACFAGGGGASRPNAEDPGLCAQSVALNARKRNNEGRALGVLGYSAWPRARLRVLHRDFLKCRRLLLLHCKIVPIPAGLVA